jgi:hypothetical protein
MSGRLFIGTYMRTYAYCDTAIARVQHLDPLLTMALKFVQDATVVTSGTGERVTWVLLAYRVPREPSTPRIAIWRRLRRLGVAQIGDGLVALPADARTREALEWVADDVLEASGTATVWQAQLTSRSAEGQVIAGMAAARAAEYDALAAKAEAAPATGNAGGLSRLRLLRRELRGVQRRDFFPPPQRQLAQAAVKSLAEQVHQAQQAVSTEPEVTAP